jgi:hypothetical protein
MWDCFARRENPLTLTRISFRGFASLACTFSAQAATAATLNERGAGRAPAESRSRVRASSVRRSANIARFRIGNTFNGK